ncbi:MAG TPA: L-threonylcarbamoyladenylate synthase [Chthonomonadales bacterium]|nr:L-threonylcarbamoyladenylate synthase [Chthonomonadales bacterium]
MRTRLLRVDPERPAPADIAEAAAVLSRGGLVAFPTETVYGLGALALDAQAAARIYAAKGRPARNPTIVHVRDVAEARRCASSWTEAAECLARRFWPGPLTLVAQRAPCVPDVVTGAGDTVGLRCPAHQVALALIRATGAPVAAPSANRSSRVSPTTAAHVLNGLDGRIDLVLDAGPCPGGLESTVVDVTAWPPRVLRPGPIAPSAIAAAAGAVAHTGEAPATPEEPLRSPGLLSRHYAPRARLECVEVSGRELALALAERGERVGWLAFGDPGDAASHRRLAAVAAMPREPDAYARRLYAALHEMDEAGVARIVADLPPDYEAWLAVRDRLRRASAPGG